MDSMLEKLMALPLFSGVTKKRMAETVGNAKFHFLKYLAGDRLIAEGETCTHIKFILSGQVRLTIHNADKRFAVQQTLTGPDVICPDYLFGRHTYYPCEAVAIDAANIVQVSKTDYLNILNSDPVFMLNYLNHLSSDAQKTIDGVMSITFRSLEERIALWIACLTQPRATDIVLAARHRDLCTVFAVQRNSFNAALDSLCERGLITVGPNQIMVTDRRAIISILTHDAHHD